MMNKSFKSLLGGYFLSNGFSQYKRGWLKGTNFSCPFCGRENKFGVNPSTNYYHCFRCDARGNLYDLICILEGVDTLNEVILILKNYKDLGYKVVEQKAEIKRVTEMILPEGFNLISQGKSQLAKSARSYLINRGFDIKALSMKGWGYANDDKHFGYIIIPFYKNHKIIYYNARQFLNPSGPRYLNPEIGESSVGKSQIIYNEEALYMYDSVYLTEGVFNCETLSPLKGICSCGKYLSAYQINTIIKSPVKRVIICLDSDATKQAFDLALKLINHKELKIIFFPDGKDANDLGLRKSLKLVYNTRYLKTYQQVIQLRNERT